MSADLAPDAITADFVAIARLDVVSVEVDGELVLYDDERQVMHRLSPTASALWQCLDGLGTLAEIAADIAAVYSAQPGQVLSDVVQATRHFGEEGLLVGIGTPNEERPPSGPDHDLGDGPGAAGGGSRGTDTRAGPVGAQGNYPSSIEIHGRDEGGNGGSFVAEMASPCMDNSFPLGEAGMMTVRAGTHLLGLRVSTPELMEAAQAVLRPALVPGVVAPANVSVVATKARAGRSLFWCYRSGRMLTRARSPHRAMAAAVALLSSYDSDGPGALARIPAVVAVRGEVAALLDPQSRGVLDRLGPLLRRAGWQVLDGPAAPIDPASGQLVVAEPAVAIDAAALAQLARDRSDGPPPAPGRYPVAAWVAVAGDDPQPETLAGRVAIVLAGAEDLDSRSAAVLLQAAATMLRPAAWVVSAGGDAGAIVRTLIEAVP